MSDELAEVCLTGHGTGGRAMNAEQIKTDPDIVKLLRQRACPPEGEYIEHDHGHSDCYLEREAADEIERLRYQAEQLDERCTKLRELIADWVAARDKWNKAMWNSDLTTEQRSLIEQELTRSINLLTVEAAWPRSVPRGSETDDLRRDLPA